MSMKPSDAILAPARGTPSQAKAYAARFRFPNADKDVGDYLTEVFRVAPRFGIDPAIVVAQSAHETGDWSSVWWVTRLNPAGIGITGDPAQNLASHTWSTGTAAAQSHVAHLRLYATGANDTGFFDPREEAYHDAYGTRAMAQTIEDLAGTWAVDPDYATGVCAKGNAIFPALPDQGGTVTHTTAIPGLPGGPLVTTYPVRLNLMALDGYRRPGTKAQQPRRSVQHGTGNAANASAWVESMYFVDGAEGRQASIHFCTDDREAVVVVPVDEVTWQAADGAGPGNMNGLSCEMMEATAIWNDPARRARLIAITADLMGRCAARLKIAQPERHWDFNQADPDRHHCPNLLMNTGLWDSSYVPQWLNAKNAELSGGDPGMTYPNGMDEGIAERLFGKVKGEDSKNYSYNEKGIISQLWLSQGKATGEFPAIKAVWVYDDGRKYFVFTGGMTLWQTSETAPPAVLK